MSNLIMVAEFEFFDGRDTIQEDIFELEIPIREWIIQKTEKLFEETQLVVTFFHESHPTNPEILGFTSAEGKLVLDEFQVNFLQSLINEKQNKKGM